MENGPKISFCTLQACAPRYYWRTEHDTPFADVTGTCYLSIDSLKTFVEYAPCRTGTAIMARVCLCVHFFGFE